MLTYVMRMGETMPIFNFWPRGREVIQRLILKAATTDNISDLNIYRTEEATLKTIIFQRLEKEKEEELNCYNSSARDRFWVIISQDRLDWLSQTRQKLIADWLLT